MEKIDQALDRVGEERWPVELYLLRTEDGLHAYHNFTTTGPDPITADALLVFTSVEVAEESANRMREAFGPIAAVGTTYDEARRIALKNPKASALGRVDDGVKIVDLEWIR